MTEVPRFHSMWLQPGTAQRTSAMARIASQIVLSGQCAGRSNPSTVEVEQHGADLSAASNCNVATIAATETRTVPQVLLGEWSGDLSGCVRL